MLKVIFQSQISFFFRRAHSPITKDFPLWSIWPNEVTELPHHPRVDRSWRISTWCDPLKHCCWIDVIDHMYVPNLIFGTKDTRRLWVDFRLLLMCLTAFGKNIKHTDANKSLTTIVLKYLVSRLLSRAGMKLHSSMSGTFFVYSLALFTLIFKKKSSRRFLGKSSKFSIVATLLDTMKSLELFPRNHRRDFFLKIGIHSAKVYTKKAPSILECNFIPAPLKSLAYKQVIIMLHY